MARIHEARHARAARAAEEAQLSTKHKIGLALTIGLAAVLSLLVAWFLETHR